ncbi:8-oxo-dGTPase Bsu YtkD / 8-oxo-GTPase Bsu YtkD [Lachnospiraceae bacterium KM106-2]|nr:8-oxo-dGTPase Bsu YtkD / 8-oxo-GTPase Bsu YtkD [Lachnospiraceae bacterium KM106-2]
MEVRFYEQVEDELLAFAVMIARSKGKWVFCKHKKRDTLEFPGGHREPGETILEAAKRELEEETGAIDYQVTPICAYSVKGKTRFNEMLDDESFGMLYLAEIDSFAAELHSEIEKVILSDELATNWTYPLIQPFLLQEVKRRKLI